MSDVRCDACRESVAMVAVDDAARKTCGVCALIAQRNAALAQVSKLEAALIMASEALQDPSAFWGGGKSETVFATIAAALAKK